MFCSGSISHVETGTLLPIEPEVIGMESKCWFNGLFAKIFHSHFFDC